MHSEDADFIPSELRTTLTGRRAFLVTNRREPGIERWLRDHLGIGIVWIDCGRARKLASARDALRSGNYDFILVTTGFVSHDVDRILKPICKQTGTLFIPIGKGRPKACVAALAKRVVELGAGQRGV